MPATPLVKYAPAFTLSELGSDRGTAYTFASKSITLAGKTFVTWTDAVAITQMRVFDHAAQTWGPTVTLGPGTDNHNSPSMTADKEGRIRVAYGPHGMWAPFPDHFTSGAFKFVRSTKPASLENLDQPVSPMGYYGTYACIAVTPDNRDVIVYRGGEGPPRAYFQLFDEKTGWTPAKPLIEQRVPPGYTHYGAQVVTTKTGTIYVIAHVYSSHVGYSHGVVALRSDDQGETWTDMAGKPVKTPTLFDPRLAVPSCPAASDPRSGGMVVDSKGTVYAITYARLGAIPTPILSKWTGSSWQAIDLSSQVPKQLAVYDVGMTIDSADRIHLLFTASTNAERKIWGQAGDEIYHLVSNDRVNFTCNRVSDGNGKLPNWHGNITLPSLHNPIDKPVIVYTQGPDPLRPPTKEGCMATVHTRIVAVLVDEVK